MTLDRPLKDIMVVGDFKKDEGLWRKRVGLIKTNGEVKECCFRGE